MKIEFYIKNVYGIPTIYLADKTLADLVASLTGKKTVHFGDLNVLEALTGKQTVEIIAPRQASV